ncbi:glycoside hydrolase family 127 protein [Parabacteroides timonensis]|uniref:glycoside hydrolase family 127 protein n=1 Tax=Parabacteroides timonensis TaxID=1871013 RepID=UPI0009E1DB80|nr:glycoside hydrolase family 127 protein [Parabacteroides timonensis]
MKNKLILTFLLATGIIGGSLACEHCTNLVQVKDVVPAKVNYFSLKDVRLLDSPFKHAMELNNEWMMELDMDRLLSNFRKNADLEPKAESYGSWEAMGIAGHTLGHYLTALSQQYASTGDEECKRRVDYIVSELDSCQINFVNGFIGGMPGGDKVFKEVKKGIIRSKGFDLNGIWVPWYNEHKTMMGLSDAYLLVGNETAKKVLVNLSDYLADIISGLSNEQIQEMLNCEYGGMNEAFAQVYALTGDKKYLDASYKFYHERLQDKLAEGLDVLPGLHSNTQIPKIIGSARQYELTGNKRDEKIAEFFWHTIVHSHSYANGGNSMGEYLSTPRKLNDRLATTTCETCNTYNMLKLSQHLYRWTDDPQYLDYYERALYNHILASQHPEDARTCYFVSLGMGTRKNFYSKDNNFTCCMGSGFENHSKYGGAIYSYTTDKNDLNVNLYIPSVLTWKERNIRLKMETAYPEDGKVAIRLEECPSQQFDINLRYPAWAISGVTLKVNGSKQSVSVQPGSFITISRKWKKGDRIEVNFPMSLYTESMPDNADRRAVFYGPSLLAGVFGPQERKIGDVPVFINEEKDMVKQIEPVKGQPLTFHTVAPGGPDNVAMIPFFKTYDQYYTVYWDVFSPEEWKQVEAKRTAELERIARLDAKTLDYITLGEMQPERDHNLEGENTRVGEFGIHKYRFAYEEGWFSFNMKCGYNEPTQFLMTYWGGDSGKYTFELVIDDTWVQPITVKGNPEEFVEMVIDLPKELTEGKDKIKVMFRGVGKNRVSNLYNCRLMKK